MKKLVMFAIATILAMHVAQADDDKKKKAWGLTGPGGLGDPDQCAMTTGLGGKARGFAVDFRLGNQLKGVGKPVFLPAFHLRLELRFELENDLGPESGHGLVGSRAAVN